jgi:glycosyltransferase involved in cell wall biosynthesis
LFVTHGIYPESVAGREKYVVRLAREWSLNHEVGIVFYSRPSNIKDLSLPRVRLHRVWLLSKHSIISKVMHIFTTVIAALIFKYDILYVNSFFIPELSGLFSKIITRKPYIVAVHNPSELISTRIKSFSYWMKKLILKNSFKIIAVSIELKRLLYEFTPLPKNKVSYIPPGVDREYFNIKQEESERNISSTPVILTSRRLVEEKGIDTLLYAVKILLDEKFKVKCIIIGRGAEYKKLIQLSKKLGVNPYVKFTGFLPDKQLKKFFSLANCFIMPSRREGTPVALFEYMALGKPVVATQIGGIVDILPNKELIVLPNDPAAMAAKIKMVLSDKEFALKVGKQNRKTAKKFVWSNIASQLFVVFKETQVSYQNITEN